MCLMKRKRIFVSSQTRYGFLSFLHGPTLQRPRSQNQWDLLSWKPPGTVASETSSCKSLTPHPSSEPGVMTHEKLGDLRPLGNMIQSSNNLLPGWLVSPSHQIWGNKKMQQAKNSFFFRKSLQLCAVLFCQTRTSMFQEPTPALTTRPGDPYSTCFWVSDRVIGTSRTLLTTSATKSPSNHPIANGSSDSSPKKPEFFQNVQAMTLRDLTQSPTYWMVLALFLA